MGLDVYIYRYKNKREEQKAAREYEKRTKNFWGKKGLLGELTRPLLAKQKKATTAAAVKAYEEKEAAQPAVFRRDHPITQFDMLTPNNQEKVRKEIKRRERAIAKEFGITSDFGIAGEKIEKPSKIHPDHYFKIGYLRSSYNEGGIDHIMRRAVNSSLADIFEPGERYEFRPNWKKALEKARRTRDALKMAFINWPFQIANFSPNMFSPEHILSVNSEAKAREIVKRELIRSAESDARAREEWAKREEDRIKALKASKKKVSDEELKPEPYKAPFGRAYSNRDGHFWVDEPAKYAAGIEMIAAICGVDEEQKPVLYVAHRTDPNDRMQFNMMEVGMGAVAASDYEAFEAFKQAWTDIEAAQKNDTDGVRSSVVEFGTNSGTYFFPADAQGFRFSIPKNAPDGDDDLQGGGLNVFAIIPGADVRFRTALPAWYAIYHAPGMRWYVDAMDIVIENCEWVLKQKNPKEYWLHWSG